MKWTILILLTACSAKVHDGIFACEEDADCPPEMVCASDGLCWRHVGPGPLSDAEVDAELDGGTDAPVATDAPMGCTVERPTIAYHTDEGQACIGDGYTEAYLSARAPLAVTGTQERIACARWQASTSPTTATTFRVTMHGVDTGCGNFCGSKCETGHYVGTYNDAEYLGTVPISRDVTSYDIVSPTNVLILCRLDFSDQADMIRVIGVSCL